MNSTPAADAMHYLIIGCGYVGRRAARVWLDGGHRVTAMTRSEKNAARLAEAGIDPVLGDVTCPETLKALPTAETVLYAVGYDRSGYRSQREVYVDGLENILYEIGSRTQRLIYLSSTSVYGQIAGEWIDETSPSEPTRSRGQICLDAERVLWAKFTSDGDGNCIVNILRLAGIYGPGRLLTPVETLQDGEPLDGHPDGFLNLIHVDDVVQAVMACELRALAGATYLVSDDEPIPRRRYYELLARLIGAPPPTFSGRGSSRHTGDSLNKRCCNRRLKDELGVQLAYPNLEAGLPSALASAD